VLQLTLLSALLACAPQGAESNNPEDLFSENQELPSLFQERQNPTESLPAGKPKTFIPGDKNLLQWQSLNLDSDYFDEEILLVEEFIQDNREVSLWIGDYKEENDDYFRVWSAPILSTAFTEPTLSLMDLTGNQNQEILILGNTNLGERSIDVFTPGEKNQYIPILSLRTQGSITIEEKPRSLTYNSGQTYGESFAIIVEENEEAGPGSYKVRRQRYVYSLEANVYRRGSIDIVEPSLSVDRSLRQALDGGISGLMDYLEGPWYWADEGSTPMVVIFQPKEDTFTVVQDDALTIYDITRADRTYRTGMVFRLVNQIARSDAYNVNLAFRGDDEIKMIPYQRFQVDGIFKRLSESAMMSMVEREPVPTMPFEPRGLYRSEIGSELTFNLPNYQLRRGDTEEEGGVAIFWNKYWILQLKAKNEEGLPVETKNYRMEFSEILEENRLIRSLHLSPGKLGITGMETGVEPSIHFEQVEFLSGES
jgi:hypothetical protein